MLRLPIVPFFVAAAVAGSLAAPRAGAQQTSPAREAAVAWTSAHEGSILREFTELLAIPNVASDSVNIERNAELLLDMLQRRGVSARLLRVPGAPPVVFGELAAEVDAPGAQTLVLYAHYDGQPVDTAEWNGSPWTPVLRSGAGVESAALPLPVDGARIDPEARLFARSASDDKASIIAMLGALDALKAAGVPRTINLKFFFEGEEEAGSPHLEQLLAANVDALRSDGWLFGDGPVHQSRRQQLVFGVRGVMGLELTVYGPRRPLHSGHYGNWAPNPIVTLTALLGGLRDTDGRILIDGFYDDVAPMTDTDRQAIAALPAVDSTLRSSLGLARTEADNALLAERLMLPALNVRGIDGGATGALSANVISTEARASIDFRLVPDQEPARVRELVEAHLRRNGWHLVTADPDSVTRVRYPRIVELEWESGYAASRAPLDGDFARSLITRVSRGTSEPPLIVPILGGSLPLSIFERILDAPVVVVPIANHDNNQHGANENLRIRNLWEGVGLYCVLMGGAGTAR
ncbi:MAG TPA: M20/M25/M40 family metallo-hydrolase [Gemmatimonadaceae bacterium]|nr:M20/M25/M40 family metallo-hydrolase [Gemmatimonadaceae bacterium]